MKKACALIPALLLVACSQPEPVSTVPIEGALVRGVNFNGAGGIEIDGYRWTSQDDSKANGMMLREVEAITTELQPKPGVDEDTQAMLNSAIAKPGKLEINQILYGAQYDLYLWVMENERGTQRTMSVEIEGQTVEEAMGNLPFKQWARYGPYPFELSDGEINIAITTADPNQKAQVMGMLIVKPDNSGSLRGCGQCLPYSASLLNTTSPRPRVSPISPISLAPLKPTPPPAAAVTH